jgi:hypothetical protein
MNRYVLLLAALGTVASAAGAQYAATLAPIVQELQIDRDQALWVAGSVAGSIPIGTEPSEAAQRLEGALPASVLRRTTESPVTVGAFAHLLLALEESPAGFWYALIPSPYTAFKQLRSVGVLDGFPTSSAPLTGADALDIARRYMAYVRTVSREDRP